MITVIIGFIGGIFSIPNTIFTLFRATTVLSFEQIGAPIIDISTGYLWGIYLTGIIKAFGSLITLPLAILFFKNFYLDLRANMGKKN